MLIRKTEKGFYEISGGVEWYKLPETIKNRRDLNKYFQHNNGIKLNYSTDDFKIARRYDIFWINNFPVARIDENETNFLVINLPAYASDEAIKEWLKTHAKNEGKEAIINFSAQRPESPEADNN